MTPHPLRAGPVAESPRKGCGEAGGQQRTALTTTAYRPLTSPARAPAYDFTTAGRSVCARAMPAPAASVEAKKTTGVLPHIRTVVATATSARPPATVASLPHRAAARVETGANTAMQRTDAVVIAPADEAGRPSSTWTSPRTRDTETMVGRGATAPSTTAVSNSARPGR